MSLVITNSEDYSSYAEVPPKTIKELAGLKLVGKGAGDLVKNTNENLLKLLQNFAGSLPPSAPVPGQLWYDVDNNALNIYNGSGWTTLTNVKRRDEFKLNKNSQQLTPSFDIINNSFDVTRNGLKLSSFEFKQYENSIIIPNSKKNDIVIISN